MAHRFKKQEEYQISFKTALYDAVLFAFIATNYLSLIAFRGETPYIVLIQSRYLNSGIILLIVTHLCLSAGELIGKAFLDKDGKRAWVKTFIYLMTASSLACFFLQKMPGLGIASFYAVTGIYLVAASWNRNFRRTVAVFLVAYAGIFLTAFMGLLLGYTKDTVRFTDYGAKHAFGMVHPNTAARIIFIIVFSLWYLFLQEKKKATWILFWGAAVFLIITNRCRTIIFLLLVFPLLWRSCYMGELKKNRGKEILIAAAPLICLGITLLLCIPINLIHRFTYDNALFSIGERFVQAGITIRQYGLPLIGHSINTSGSVKMIVDGEKIALFAVDNAFISYGVIRGLLWLIPCMCLLCLANRLAWKKADYAIAVLGVLMSVFAVLERYGLDPAFNLLFFYPLSVLGESRLHGQDDMGTLYSRFRERIRTVGK